MGADDTEQRATETEGPVRLGVDRLLEAGPGGLRDYGVAPRLGLLTHDGARVGPASDAVGPPNARSGPDVAMVRGHSPPLPTSRAALLLAGFDIVRLFSPEHGILASAPDGAGVEDGADPETGLPVCSLYGPELRPTPDRLSDLDLVLVDLQDVGVRFYTYLWTVVRLMQAAEDAGVPVLILDRPNPLGGVLSMAEGPILANDHTSFLGGWAVPIRHSLTLGEMTGLLHEEMGIGTAVDVKIMAGLYGS